VTSSSASPGAFCGRCGQPRAPAHAFCVHCGAAADAEPSHDSDPMLGRVIEGRFRIVSCIGQGGMGAVYEAEHTALGKRVAVKVLRADLRSNAELVQRFRREAMVVSRLTDPHTVTVFDYGVVDGLAFIVMEYLRGQDLARVIADAGRLPVARAFAIAHQVCSSLTEAHEVGLVHRDLKPENLFIARAASGEDHVKVLDFGLAKLVGDVLERDDPAAFTTQHGRLMGTPYFMAPEQVRGMPVDARADLYALGALLYRMLTGEYPHRGRTPVEVMESHLSGVFRPLHEVAASAQIELPDGCEALVHRLLLTDAALRPSSAREVAQALSEISRRAQTQAPRLAEWAHGTWEGKRPALEPETDDVTRVELEAYERSLRWGAWRRGALTLAVLGGLAFVAVWTLTAVSPPLRAEVEPNDKVDQANALTPDVELAGYLGRRLVRDQSDRDVFRVEASAGERVRLEVTGVPGLDLILEGFDGGGHVAFKADDGRRGEGERVEAMVPAEGLFVQVREVWVLGTAPTENSTDAYRLRAARPTQTASP